MNSFRACKAWQTAGRGGGCLGGNKATRPTTSRAHEDGIHGRRESGRKPEDSLLSMLMLTEPQMTPDCLIPRRRA
jgi:hypothetical protein